MNEILLGNCLDLFKELPSDSVDICFADPPFNLKKRYKTYKDNLETEQYLKWCYEWLSEMVRVTKPTGSIFVHNIPKWLIHCASYLNKIVQFSHWISWDASTAPMGESLQPAHYGILYYTKSPTRKFYEIRHPNKRCRSCKFLLKDYGGKKIGIPPFGPLVSDVWTDIHRCKHNKYRDKHPCQLPIHLLERIILMSTDENDVVLDPFMGTGTTAIAAKRLGRRYLGYEISEEYKCIAEDKLNKETISSQIGKIWVSCFLNKIITARDIDTKTDEFKSFFEWPNTNDDIIALNQNSIKLKDDIGKKIKHICTSDHKDIRLQKN